MQNYISNDCLGIVVSFLDLESLVNFNVCENINLQKYVKNFNIQEVLKFAHDKKHYYLLEYIDVNCVDQYLLIFQKINSPLYERYLLYYLLDPLVINDHKVLRNNNYNLSLNAIVKHSDHYKKCDECLIFMLKNSGSYIKELKDVNRVDLLNKMDMETVYNYVNFMSKDHDLFTKIYGIKINDKIAYKLFYLDPYKFIIFICGTIYLDFIEYFYSTLNFIDKKLFEKYLYKYFTYLWFHNSQSEKLLAISEKEIISDKDLSKLKYSIRNEYHAKIISNYTEIPDIYNKYQEYNLKPKKIIIFVLLLLYFIIISIFVSNLKYGHFLFR